MLEIGVLIVFLAITLLVLGILWKEENPMDKRMASIRGSQLSAGSSVSYAPVKRQSFTERVVAPMADSLGRGLTSVLPSGIVGQLDKQLIQAGQPITLGGFLVAIFLVELVLLSSVALIVLTSAEITSLQGLFFPVALALGFMLPKIWLSNRVKHRQKEILKSLPDAFDLITTCVEAGLGLDSALAKVAEKVEGPFAEELLIALKETSLGKLRREALKEMGERAGVPDLTTFINAVIQAETMGTSIATVLRVQSDQMRMRRRQRAEQQAHQAPVKMIFPLALCIFPTLFIVILGPAGISIYESFVGAGG
jgi:tight adherence protein C